MIYQAFELRLNINTMFILEEGNFLHERSSLRRCTSMFGFYGHFALTPLFTAVWNSDRYDWYTFKLRYQSFSRHQGITEMNYPGFTEYINSLAYEDKDYFSIEECAFLMEFQCPGPALWQPPDEDKFTKDLKEVRKQSRKASEILKSHAKILLKALEYWKLRYGENYKQWQLEHVSAGGAFQARREAGLGECEIDIPPSPPRRCSTCDPSDYSDVSDWDGLSEFEDETVGGPLAGANGRGRGGRGGGRGRGRGGGRGRRRGMIPAPAGTPVTWRDTSIRGRSSVRGRGGPRGRGMVIIP
jgi:hypothetical protein